MDALIYLIAILSCRKILFTILHYLLFNIVVHTKKKDTVSTRDCINYLVSLVLRTGSYSSDVLAYHQVFESNIQWEMMKIRYTCRTSAYINNAYSESAISCNVHY